jgi:nucleotide-binding universal stress UspA family protein
MSMKSGIVLCAIDFSPSARGALTEAAAIVRQTGERLVLVHVAQMVTPPPELPILPPDLVQEAAVALQAQLDAWRGDAVAAGAREVDTRLMHGAAWDRIVALARELNARLIVMGTHGRTGLRHVLLGSVAEKVARHAPCSVLVTRAPESAP